MAKLSHEQPINWHEISHGVLLRCRYYGDSGGKSALRIHNDGVARLLRQAAAILEHEGEHEVDTIELPKDPVYNQDGVLSLRVFWRSRDTKAIVG